jgi:hypothetical protein
MHIASGDSSGEVVPSKASVRLGHDGAAALATKYARQMREAITT